MDKFMKFIQVIDWQSKEKSRIPSIGERYWIRWLIARNYQIISQEKLGSTAMISLYAVKDTNSYAIYCPSFSILDSEHILTNISTEEAARALIHATKQKLESVTSN
jgi:hypothetical protein